MAVSIFARRLAGANLLFIMACISANAADVFYADRLEAARLELRSGNNMDAEDDLRLAAFGMLNDPQPLITSEALLAVARNRLGNATAVTDTLERFVRLESRLQVYSPSLLPPEFRKEFEDLLKRTVSASTLAGVPTLAPLVGAIPVTRTSTTIPAPQTPSPSQSTRPPPRTMASEADYADYQRARTLISEGRSEEAVSLLSTLTQRTANVRQFRLTLLQALVFNSNWDLAAAQVAQLLPFTDSEATFTFYGAIAMYQIQKFEQARALLEQASPRLVPSTWTNSWVEKIRSAS